MHVFWPEKFYNVEMFWQPGGAFQGYYVNLSLPFERETASLSYTDLELDISWYTGEEIKLLDVDDYAAMTEQYALPLEIIAKISGATQEALGLMQSRAFPFDGSLEAFFTCF